MDAELSEKLFVSMMALAAFVVVFATWAALSWQRPIQVRIDALASRRVKTRREQQRQQTAASEQGATPMSFMRQVADRLNLLRGNAADQTTRKLRQAGYYARDASVVYVFVKLALPLGLGFAMLVLMSFAIDVPEDLVLPLCVGGVLAGFVLPDAYLKNKAAKRREILNYVLPEGLDLLTICVEAGLSIDAAFRRVSREMQGSMPELATEFDMTAIELTYLPDRQQALENLASRSNSAAIAALVNALRQTEKYGTPLAGSLRILSQEFRQTRASKAEEKGARMPALMTVPLMVFILPTLITVLVAPAVLQVLQLT